ncbi:MAG: Rne/Rng family ribonuclease [Terriglobia bacterium]
MSKELIISVTPQETKTAIIENDQVVEIHIERDKEHGIVGAICKGRVTKVLPGMQSAFVDIGLERDAFLYVSDFFEDTEEYDRLVSTTDDQVAGGSRPAGSQSAAVSHPPVISPEVVGPPSSFFRYGDRRGRSRRSRRNRLRGKHHETPNAPAQVESPAPATPETVTLPPVAEPAISILPGESLAKYHQVSPLVEETSLRQETPGDSESDLNAGFVAEPSHAESTSVSKAAILPAQESTVDPGSYEEGIEIPEGSEDEVQETVGTVDEGVTPLATAEAAFVSSAPGPAAQASLEREELRLAQVDEIPQLEATEEEMDEAREIALEGAGELIASKEPLVVAAEGRSEASGENEEITDPQGGVEPSSEHEEAAAATAGPSGSPAPPPAKAEIRGTPGTSKFFRRSNERRRRSSRPQAERRHEENESRFPLIADLLKEGQEILVQIAKEPLGTKGARITSHIALPGRYLVYMPTVDHIGVSRKIESDEERQRLKRIIQQHRRPELPGGFIVRTAGQGRGEDEFVSDINFLYALWGEIKARADKNKAGTIIHRDLSLVQRILRDQLSNDYVAIRVDNEFEYATIVEFINRFQPSLVNRVKLYAKDTPIFEEFGVQGEIDKALRNKVWLKSGGYIVIDQAEALVAIDVNTGKYVGKSNKLEDTIVKTNIEAAKEIARQIRLRDLGGIIVCDFIDMDDRKNRFKVTQTLEEALRVDRSPSKVLEFNDFGLVAITRKRVKQSILRTLCEPCPSCIGLGMVKSAQTVCYDIQAEAKKMGRTLENREITIRVSPEVAKALKSTEISVLHEIESVLKKEVVIKSDPLLSQEHFDIF